VLLLSVRGLARDRNARRRRSGAASWSTWIAKRPRTGARGLLPQSGSFDQFTLEMFALGGGALPIFGTREQVAESLDRLYRSGMDGVLMVFLSYYQDTLRFEREIMPLLRQLGTIR